MKYTDDISYDKVNIAIAEANRFIEKANRLRGKHIHFANYGTPISKSLKAEVKRASLDLSRALIEMRKG